MTTGEGGMVTTGSETLASRMRQLSLHGMNRDAWNRYSERGNWYYEVTEPGFKYNLMDIQSALGIHQLRKLESFIGTRTSFAEIYHRELGDLAELEIPQTRAGTRHSWHLYILRLNLNLLDVDRQEFITELRDKGVGTSVHFIPIPLHPHFAGLDKDRRGSRRALELYPRIVSLPLYPAMTEEQVRHVAQCVKDVVAVHKLSTQVCFSETS